MQGKVEICGVNTSRLQVLKSDEIGVVIDLNAGSSSAKAWGCDLTYDYVKINGDYRT